MYERVVISVYNNRMRDKQVSNNNEFILGTGFEFIFIQFNYGWANNRIQDDTIWCMLFAVDVLLLNEIVKEFTGS